MKVSITKRFKTLVELGEKYLREFEGIEPDYATIAIGFQDDGVTWNALLQYEADGFAHPEFVTMNPKKFEGTEHEHKMHVEGTGKTLTQALISLEDLLLKLMSINIVDEYEEEFKKAQEEIEEEMRKSFVSPAGFTNPIAVQVVNDGSSSS